MATFCTCSTLFCTFLCCCFARLQRETSRNILDPVHMYPDSKNFHVHTYPYSNRICPATCIRIRHGFTLVPREYRQQSMRRDRHLEYSIHGKELGLLKSFLANGPITFQVELCNRWKLSNRLNLPDLSGNSPQIRECYWPVCKKIWESFVFKNHCD